MHIKRYINDKKRLTKALAVRISHYKQPYIIDYWCRINGFIVYVEPKNELLAIFKSE